MGDAIGSGDMARQMAAAPLDVDKGKVKAAVAAAKNPILAVLGSPTFMAGDGRTYPRTTGFGNSRKPHPDGGTNETAAFVVFKPFSGVDITLEGRIYCERFSQDGIKKRVFSVSIPVLKAERRDAAGRQAIENVKAHIRDLYRNWANSDAAKAATSKVKTASSDRWEEADE